MNDIVKKTERKKRLNDKKIKGVVNTSVLSLHNDKLKYFESLSTIELPKKKKKLKELISNSKSSNSNINEKEISLLEKEVYSLENNTEMNEYFLSTANILNDYFDNTVVDKSEVIRKYYEVVGLQCPLRYNIDTKLEIYDQCKNCKSDELIKVEVGVSCMTCGLCVYDLPFDNHEIEQSCLTYEEEQNSTYTNRGTYIRLNYFKEQLNQIQANENTDISQEVIDKLIVEIKKERVKDLSKLSVSFIKRQLKKIGYSKHYEHAPYIISLINHKKIVTIPKEVEDKMISLFIAIQIPWDTEVKAKHKVRSNFFSYPYTIYKLFELLNLREYLEFFPLLKERTKVYAQDIIWKDIIEYMSKINKESLRQNIRDVEWRFIRSV